MSESGVARTHAFETVHAYCDKHLLKLTALIVLSPSSVTRRQEFRHRSSYWRAQSQLLGVRPSALWSSGDDLTMIETIPIVEDYVEMLSKASGRVILLSHEERECYCMFSSRHCPESPHNTFVAQFADLSRCSGELVNRSRGTSMTI